MWMAWVRAIGGRLKGDFRISSELVYNTFPWPDAPTGPARQRIVEGAKRILDGRAAFASSTLDALYDPLTMPPDLLRAHADVDREVDRLYGRGTFDEMKRLAALLQRYEQLTRLTVPTGLRPVAGRASPAKGPKTPIRP